MEDIKKDSDNIPNGKSCFCAMLMVEKTGINLKWHKKLLYAFVSFVIDGILICFLSFII